MMEHKMTIERKSEQARGSGPPTNIRFRGVCECGARSSWQVSTGLVHAWDTDHRELMESNRFPALTSRLAIQAATLRLARKSKRATGDGLLLLGHRLADELRDRAAMEGTGPTDPERLALDLWEAATETARNAPGSWQ